MRHDYLRVAGDAQHPHHRQVRMIDEFGGVSATTHLAFGIPQCAVYPTCRVCVDYILELFWGYHSITYYLSPQAYNSCLVALL